MRDFLVRTIYNRSYVLDIMVALLLTATIFFLVGQRNLTQQLTDLATYNKQLNTRNQDILARVQSCTDPQGACYQANTTRSQDAVNNINKIAVLVAACADAEGRQTASEIEKCIKDQLKTH